MKKKLKKKLTKKKTIDKIIFLENLNLLISKGYSLSISLNIMSYRFNVEKILKKLSAGEKFCESIETLELSDDILLIISISEASGKLKEGINHAYQALKEKDKQKNGIQDALKYPFIMLIIIMFILYFVNSFLIPQFRDIYIQFDLNITLFYQIMFWLIWIIPKLILSIFIICFILKYWYDKLTEREKIKLFKKFPALNTFYIRYYNYLFATELFLILSTGMQIEDALKILKDQNNHKLIKEESEKILIELSMGNSFKDSLDDKLYTEEFIIMIKNAEEIGFLKDSLENYIKYAFQNLNNSSKNMMFWLQPIIYFFIGGIIIILYASILLPMYNMMESLY